MHSLTWKFEEKVFEGAFRTNFTALATNRYRLTVNQLPNKTVFFLISEDWYFWSHRRNIARAARKAGWRVVVGTRVADHRDLIEKEGFEVESVEVRRGAHSPLRDLLYIYRVFRLYRKHRPTVVHHVGIKPILYGSIAARAARVPSMVNAVAGLGYLFTSPRWRERLIRTVVLRSLKSLLNRPRSVVIVHNADDRAIFAGRVVCEDQVVTINGSGVDISHFSPMPEPTGDMVVAQVGRLLWDKGVETLVSAAALLRASQVPVRVVLVGAADPANPASIDDSALQRWKREGNVEFWGFRNDVRTVWAEAAIAVLASVREGMPKALLEAGACGRPLVAMAVPGCRELIREGENGLLVPPGDPEALAAAIRRLVESPEERRRMGAAAREITATQYADETVTQRTLEIYDQIAGENSNTPLPRDGKSMVAN